MTAPLLANALDLAGTVCPAHHGRPATWEWTSRVTLGLPMDL